MGNARSSTFDENNEDTWWSNETQQKHRSISTSTSEIVPELNVEREQRRKELAVDFENFKLELARKHEKRRQILAEKRREMMDTREELIAEKKKNEELKELLKKAQQKSDEPRSAEDLRTIADLKEESEDLRNEMEKLRLQLKEKEIISEKNKELRISLAEMQKELQSANTEIIGFQKERIDYQEHVTALKDVVKVSKEMLMLRENQIEELRKKITGIEELLASKEMNVLSTDLRQEYEKQLRNIRNLRALYEERQRADKREKEDLQSQIEELKKNAEEEHENKIELEERISALERENSEKCDTIENMQTNLSLTKADRKELQAEMAIINQLFSQILLGFNSDQEIDLDKLVKMLEENHDLLTNIVINEESKEVSVLPKVLLDLVNQVNENKDKLTQVDSNDQTTVDLDKDSQTTSQYQLNSPEEIVENLPKVWKVLIELLSHQSAPNNVLIDNVHKTDEKDNPCYKSIQTPNGTRWVLSVSKTFIRLKDLILEKKFLEKETTRMKQLNTHLECRLQDQEKRLVLVSSELTKTWHAVGKMQKQHQQLHTQEKILRYELAQKRKLLTELKQELEYCREKWLQARKKNSSTEEQWKQLRTEFTSRKTCVGDDYNNSVESGFSDDKSSSEDEDPAFDTEGFPNVKECITSNIDDVIEESANNNVFEITIGDNDNQEQPNAEHNSEPSLEAGEGFSSSLILTGQADLSEASAVNSTNEVPHSLEETQKTDLVQNISQERQENSVLLTHISNELLICEACDATQERSDCCMLENTNDSQSTLSKAAEEHENVLQTVEEHSLSIDTSTSEAENVLQTAKECIQSHISPANEPENILHTAEYNKQSHSLSIDTSTNESENVLQTAEEYIQSNISPVDTYATETENILQTAEEYIQSHSLSNDGYTSQSQNDLEPSTSTNVRSSSSANKTPFESAQEFVARREARMKRLEEQCEQVYFKAASTAIKSLKISHKLDNLHETYGESCQEEACGSNNSETSQKLDEPDQEKQ